MRQRHGIAGLPAYQEGGPLYALRRLQAAMGRRAEEELGPIPESGQWPPSKESPELFLDDLRHALTSGVGGIRDAMDWSNDLYWKAGDLYQTGKDLYRQSQEDLRSEYVLRDPPPKWPMASKYETPPRLEPFLLGAVAGTADVGERLFNFLFGESAGQHPRSLQQRLASIQEAAQQRIEELPETEHRKVFSTVGRLLSEFTDVADVVELPMVSEYWEQDRPLMAVATGVFGVLPVVRSPGAFSRLTQKIQRLGKGIPEQGLTGQEWLDRLYIKTDVTPSPYSPGKLGKIEKAEERLEFKRSKGKHPDDKRSLDDYEASLIKEEEELLGRRATYRRELARESMISGGMDPDDFESIYGQRGAKDEIFKMDDTDRLHSRIERDISLKRLREHGENVERQYEQRPSGFAAGEAEWAGLPDMLRANPDRIFSDSDILRHLDESGIRIKERWHGGDPGQGLIDPNFDSLEKLGINEDSYYFANIYHGDTGHVRRILESGPGQAPGGVEPYEFILSNDGPAYEEIMYHFPELVGNDDWAKIVLDDLMPNREYNQLIREEGWTSGKFQEMADEHNAIGESLLAGGQGSDADAIFARTQSDAAFRKARHLEEGRDWAKHLESFPEAGPAQPYSGVRYERGGDPLYSSSTVPGPYENYREVEIILDRKLPPEIEKALEDELGITSELLEGLASAEHYLESTRILEGMGGIEAAQLRVDRLNRILNPDRYKGGHYPEDVLVHIRMSDRIWRNPKTGKDERILFIEEIQSDWHQEGRKRGYRGQPRSTEGWNAHLTGDTADAGGAEWVVRDANGDLVGYTPARDEAEALRIMGVEGDLPDAPYKDTEAWTELAMRTAIREGVEGGYDRIAFVTGAQNSVAAGHRKYANEISYNETDQTLSYWDEEFLDNPTEVLGNVTVDDLKKRLSEEDFARLMEQSHMPPGRYWSVKEPVKPLDQRLESITVPSRFKDDVQNLWRLSGPIHDDVWFPTVLGGDVTVGQLGHTTTIRSPDPRHSFYAETPNVGPVWGATREEAIEKLNQILIDAESIDDLGTLWRPHPPSISGFPKAHWESLNAGGLKRSTMWGLYGEPPPDISPKFKTREEAQQWRWAEMDRQPLSNNVRNATIGAEDVTKEIPRTIFFDGENMIPIDNKDSRGMINFYDQITPSTLTGYGPNVGGIEIDPINMDLTLLDGPQLQNSIVITPEMKNIVEKKGQRIYGATGGVGLFGASRLRQEEDQQPEIYGPQEEGLPQEGGQHTEDRHPFVYKTNVPKKYSSLDDLIRVSLEGR